MTPYPVASYGVHRCRVRGDGDAAHTVAMYSLDRQRGEKMVVQGTNTGLWVWVPKPDQTAQPEPAENAPVTPAPAVPVVPSAQQEAIAAAEKTLADLKAVATPPAPAPVAAPATPPVTAPVAAPAPAPVVSVGTPPTNPPTAITQEQLADMSIEAINANWEAINKLIGS